MSQGFVFISRKSVKVSGNTVKLNIPELNWEQIMAVSNMIDSFQWAEFKIKRSGAGLVIVATIEEK